MLPKIPRMIRSRLWLKAALLILFITAISMLSIAFYTIPLTRDITYKMSETHATALLDHVYDLVEAKYREIEFYRKFALEIRKREMKNITSAAGYIIKNEYAAAKAGVISEADARQRAIEQMQSVRYGNKDYMWISNFDSVLISHPDPKLQDADFSEVRDIYGNLIVPPMVEVARKNGEGFTSYWWNRLEMDSPSEKLTYSTLFVPWSWVYGTGVYLDDIVQEVDRRKKGLVNDLQELMLGATIGKSGYIFIFDADMNMIIHPNEQLKNKKLDGLLNPRTGKQILKELMDTARIKGAHLKYPWDRPEDLRNYVYEKISWVRYNNYFNWYIASSVYTDELYSQSRFLTSRIAFITIIIILFSLIIGSYFLKKILSPIEKLSKTALRVQSGDLKIRSGIVRHDEIGILAREFDAMVEKLDGHVEELDKKVKEKTRELAENYSKLEYANSQVMESIQYARNIQHAILPHSETKPREISDSFVLWRPKDIIGGDIFWLTRNQKGFIFAVIDCTGHGVPGAIMTMIACMALNQIVQELGQAGCHAANGQARDRISNKAGDQTSNKAGDQTSNKVNDQISNKVNDQISNKVSDQVNNKLSNNFNKQICPGAILKELNRVVQLSLGQDSRDAESDDGLDIAICSVDTDGEILIFAGANLSLFIQENGEIQRIKGDRQSIGYKSSDLSFDFKEHKIEIDRKKQFYMTTDGLISQVGGNHALPFGRRRFLKCLSEHHHYGFSDQKKALEKVLSQYQGDEEQRDDITVVGFTCGKGKGDHA